MEVGPIERTGGLGSPGKGLPWPLPVLPSCTPQGVQARGALPEPTLVGRA
jgi:hypothetical protein